MPKPKRPKRNEPQKLDKATAMRIAASRAAETSPVPKFAPPQLMAGVVPDGQRSAIAMDYAPGVYDYANMMYGGDGYYQPFPGYPYLSGLTTRAEYRQLGSTMAMELTREWIEFGSNADDDESDNPRIAELEKRMKDDGIQHLFQTIAEHDCYFGRGQIAVTIPGQDRQLPLIINKATVPQGCNVRFSDVEPIWTTPVAYNALDPVAPDFYRPREWFILGQPIHASRLLTVITRPLPDILRPAYNFSGMSLSQLAQPYVENWLRTRQSVSDLINQFSTTALATAMDEVLSGNDDGGSVLARAELFTNTRSNKGLMLLDKDREELVQINTPLSGLSELQAQAQEHLCSVSRIPAMILTGISPSGLNADSEGEVRAFYDWIKSIQAAHYTKPLDVVIKLLMLDMWGEIDESITWKWCDLWQVSSTEQADIRSKDAQTDSAYLDRGVLSPEEVRQRLAGDPYSGYSGIDVSDVPEQPEGEFNGEGEEEPAQEEDKPSFDMAIDAEWKEGDHPRAENGQFGNSGGGSSKKKVSKLTANEKSAVSSYSGDDFLEVNKKLRSGDASGEQIARIDNAIDKQDVPEGTTLYRGMSREAAKRLFGGGQIDKGMEISDAAFASTTKSQFVANSIGLGGVVLKIETGANAKGLDMKGLTRNEHEEEVLLPRGAKMIVQGISPPKGVGQPIVVRVRYGD